MSNIAERTERAISENVFPGCVIGIVRTSGKRFVMPFGTLRYDGVDAVTEETVYDIASVTKSIPTASLALMMIEGSSLSLDEKVRAYVPELRNDKDATIRDLLTYNVTGLRLSSLAAESPDGILRAVFKHGFDTKGTREYTNLPALLLGVIIERIAGAPLDTLASENFFEPLGMTRTSCVRVTNSNIGNSNIAPTEIDEMRGEVCGLPHDESAYAFATENRAVGHAGLFSTAPDLLNYLEALLRGAYPYITSGAEKGLGWTVDEDSFMGIYASPRTFGKTGFTGTSVLCDMERGLALTILSNRTYPKRPTDAVSPDSDMNIFRRDIADIILADTNN